MSASTLPGFDLVGNIGGRFYMNLSVVHAVAAAIGVKSLLGAVEQVFGKLPPGLEVPLVGLSRWQIVKRVLPVAVGIRLRVRRNLRGMPAFLAASPARCEELRGRVAAAATAAELAELWERELRPHAVTAFQMLEAAGRQGGATLVMTRHRLYKLVGEIDAEAMLTGVNADGELASMGLLTGLSRLAAGEIGRDEFARAYGHRGPPRVRGVHPAARRGPRVDRRPARRRGRPAGRHRAAPRTPARRQGRGVGPLRPAPPPARRPRCGRGCGGGTPSSATGRPPGRSRSARSGCCAPSPYGRGS
ncbi:hypothetical protein [Nonomuraea salmonea]|uniref:hypothetical protein n=1 Tax=Nonomuraea salmonea TaxID=46181 RepID=UPI002FE978C2